MRQRRGGQNAGSPLATTDAGYTGQDGAVLLDELLPADVAEEPETNKRGRRRSLRARQQRPDSAYVGTPYAIDSALLQQQQQQEIEPSVQHHPFQRPSLSSGHSPSSSHAPTPPQQHHQLPSLYYCNSLYGPDTASAAAAAATAAGPSPRMRPSPKAVAAAHGAYLGTGNARHFGGQHGGEGQEGNTGTLGLLQQLSQGALRRGTQVQLFGRAASGATSGITSILDAFAALDTPLERYGAAESGERGGDDDGLCGRSAGLGGAGQGARRLSDPEEENDGWMRGADGGKPLVARQRDPGGEGGPGQTALGGAVVRNSWGGPNDPGGSGLSEGAALGFAGAVAIKRVEDALLWRDPWLSARALAGGLYLIVCVQQAVKASTYLRPTTLILAAAFLILVANLAAAAYRAFRNAAHRHAPNRHHHHHHHKLVSQHNGQPLPDQLAPDASLAAGAAQPPAPRSNQRRPHGSSDGGSKQQHGRQHRARQRWGEVGNGIGGVEGEVLHGGGVFGQHRAEQEGEGGAVGLGGGVRSSTMMRHAMEQERLVYQWTHLILSAFTRWAIPLAAACCAVVYRALSGRRLATTVLVAASLWLGMLLSELDVMSPSTFCGLLYTTVFTLPASYIRCRQVMDGAVETILRFLARLLVSGDRASLLLTTSTLLLVFSTTSFSLVSRVSLALACAMCVLVYTTLFRPSSRQSARA
ncbi:hypothetical protein DUNSADRAFT_17894 [Dunaliella salina]|uniref:Reticulon-like protein n=1 Tax=Dunaliella salina TaxID=3046 RepID=A0ABQ7H8Y2_DUNSA|nr:hypothetical protein DUNSADRAFT_17894 [Dunaliella salina]|eukprot:KAF5843317.1 hypothetical protein DUNSADRAFT_17894 [Dunaliella salina]